MVKVMSKSAEAATLLADLSPDELAKTVQTAAERHIGRSRAARLSVYITSLLAEDAQVGRLSGSAFDVIEHLDSLRQQQLLIRSAAHRRVLGEPLLDSSAVAEALGRSASNGREAASKLRLDSRLVGIKQANRYLYPAFQFDLVQREVPAVVAEINQVLDAAGDPWGVASWWISETPRLGGRAPRELIGHQPDESDLLALARAESSD